MSEIITIDPMTRISGFLEIRAEVEQNTITNVEAQGLLYRGFETMLKGRPPLDAVYFTERICGICSAAHSFASSLALENALHINVTENDSYIREIIHGFEYVQNHLRHFYLLVLPSYVKISSLPVVSEQQYTDFRIPDEISQKLQQHYIEGIEFSRLSHEGQAVLGGKAPHNHGIFVGGVTTEINAYKLEKIKSAIRKLLSFVTTAMAEDVQILAYYYPDYYNKGISYSNFMSFGAFNHEDDAISYVKPGILMNGTKYELQPEKFQEQINYSWYQNTETQEEVDISSPEAYSFVKAPRYDGMPMEVGPLARMLISGNYNGGHSCMDRIIARRMETEKILNIMYNLTNRIEIIPNSQRVYLMPMNAQGAGLTDTIRGALGHWININNKIIEHYNIITPTAWNLSPKDASGVPGVIERALIGTVINDMRNPVEIGRIVRSFDPCVSCATHLFRQNGNKTVIEFPV